MKTLTILLLSVALVQVSAIRCVAQDWQWIRHIGGPGNDFGKVAAEDEEGNIYVLVGYAKDTQGVPFPITHENCYINGDTVEGSADAFIAKYDPTGQLLWLVNCVSPAGSIGLTGLVVDTTVQAIFITGSYEVGCVLDTITLSAGAFSGAFLSRWSYGGRCSWAYNVASAAADLNGSRCGLHAVTMGGVDALVVAGMTTRSTPTTVQGQPFPFGSFIAAYDYDGMPLWAMPFMAQYQSAGVYPVDLASSDGSVFAQVAYFLYSATDSVSLDTSTVSGGAQSGYFLARIDPGSGVLIWLKREGINGGGPVLDPLTTDQYGRPVVAGLFNDSVFFSTDTLLSTTPTVWSSFIAVHDTTGAVVYARAFHSSGGVSIESVVSDPAGGFYTIGQVSPGYGNWDGVPFEVANGRQVFVSRHAPDGACLGVFTDGSGPLVSPRLVASHDGLYVTIDLSHDIVNGSITIGDSTLTTYGYRDVLLAKLDRVTGIQSFSNPQSSGLHIYANPNNGLCTIDLPEALRPSNDLFLSVYDNTGQLVQRAPLQFTDGGIRLDVRAQAKGLYHVELGDGRQRYTGTIVFE